MSERRYLGDSVYVEVERGMFKLTTENGYPDDPSNTIYLEPDVYDALVRYAESAFAKAREENENPPHYRLASDPYREVGMDHPEFRHRDPEPVPVARLWAETWIEIPCWEGVTIDWLSTPYSVLTWPDPGEAYRFQSAVVSNADLAGVLFPASDGTARCRCGHPEGEHTIVGECAIARGRNEACGCPKFVTQATDSHVT